MITERKKIEDSTILGWVFLMIFIVWNCFWISLWAHEKFAFNWSQGDDWLGVLIISVLTFLLGSLFLMCSVSREWIRTIEYKIFEFELWDSNISDYLIKYDYGTKNLYGTYFLNFQISNTVSERTEKDIQNKFNGKSSFSQHAYPNKEEVMNSILKIIKESITDKKISQDILIRNVSTSEVITVEELMKMVSNETK
jgi:hypothetical protein